MVSLRQTSITSEVEVRGRGQIEYYDDCNKNVSYATTENDTQLHFICARYMEMGRELLFHWNHCRGFFIVTITILCSVLKWPSPGPWNIFD